MASELQIQMFKRILDEKVENSPTPVPESSKKNYYTKACWLLAQFQKYAAYDETGNIVRNIAYTKEMLDPLRAEVRGNHG